MPDSSLTAAIEEAYASAPADEIVYHTLEFDHADFVQPIYVVRDRADLTATLEDGVTEVTFTAFGFDFHLPPIEQTASPEIVISIDNVGREIMPYLDAAAQSPDLVTVTYRPYLSSDLSAPQMDPPLTMVVREITVDVFKVECRATFGDFANRRFPNDYYDAQRFPGLIAT